MKNKYKSVLISSNVLSFIVATLMMVGTASAASLSTTIGVTGACIGTVNGSSSTTVNVTKGDNVNLTVGNTDNSTSQSVSGTGIPAGSVLQANTKTSTNSTQTFQLGVVNSAITINFTPIASGDTSGTFVNNCPSGSTPVASTLTINPVAAPAASSSTGSSSSSKPSTSSSSSASAATPAATATSTETTPEPGSTNSAPVFVSSTTKDSGLSTASKIIFGLAVAAGIALAVVILKGYGPFRKFGMRPRGKKAPRKRRSRK